MTPGRGTGAPLQQVALLAAYGLLAHLWAATGQDFLARLAVVALVCAAGLRQLQQRRTWAVLALVAVTIAAATTRASAWAPLLLLLTPVVINAGLALLFGHTLAPGNTPLVARIVALLHIDDGMSDPAVWSYARSVTVCWTALFGINTILCLLLAMLATPSGLLAVLGIATPLSLPMSLWSAFANFGCYGLSALMFVLEFAYRRRRFPWQPYRNLFHFLARAASVGPALARQFRSRHESDPRA